MDIYKPKPIRNWREFLKEYAIIVIGVLTALAAEQAAEYVHWRNQVAEAKGLIAAEMAGNVRLTIARLRTASCSEHRLDELAGIVDAAAKSGNLPPVGDFAEPPRGYWRSGSWESVVASQAATHFPREQLADLTAAYKMVIRQQDFGMEEIGAWDNLYAMVGPGRRLDPASEAKLREALSHARSINRLVTIIGAQYMGRVKALNLPFSPGDLAGIEKIRRGSLMDSTGTIENAGSPPDAICEPFGKVPSLYGQGSFSAVVPLFDNAVKIIPDFGKGAP